MAAAHSRDLRPRGPHHLHIGQARGDRRELLVDARRLLGRVTPALVGEEQPHQLAEGGIAVQRPPRELLLEEPGDIMRRRSSNVTIVVEEEEEN